jgi:hypothetical protein
MSGAPDPTDERVPLSSLLRVGGELIGWRERRIRRQRRLPPFEGRANRETQGFAFERPAHGEAPDIEEVLHPAVRQAETNHRFGLLGDRRLSIERRSSCSEIFKYTCVCSIVACPSISWIVRMSTPR